MKRGQLVAAFVRVGFSVATSEISRDEAEVIKAAMRQVMTGEELADALNQLCELHEYADKQEDYANANP